MLYYLCLLILLPLSKLSILNDTLRLNRQKKQSGKSIGLCQTCKLKEEVITMTNLKKRNH